MQQNLHNQFPINQHYFSFFPFARALPKNLMTATRTDVIAKQRETQFLMRSDSLGLASSYFGIQVFGLLLTRAMELPGD